MEKLIELLNEWYQERYKTNPHFNKFEDYWGNDYWYFIWDDKLMVETEVRTKKYWFIKWLVDNDKIDRKKLEIRPFSDELVYSDSDCTVYRSGTTYEMLLMLLSISDTPIDDLIGYLK